MRYKRVIPATFVERTNRFIARAEVDGTVEAVHVKNTGRLRELLLPGVRVWLSVADDPSRKTKYDLVAVEKETECETVLVNIDSQMPNAAVEDWLRSGALFGKEATIRREVTYGDSRFDFYVEDGERRAFLEVKGCTLERGGVALFPDAPTERGVKHLHGLAGTIRDGYEAYALIVIQMKGVREFRPNDDTHPKFGEAMREARDAGVRIIAVDCIVEPDTTTVDREIPVVL